RFKEGRSILYSQLQLLQVRPRRHGRYMSGCTGFVQFQNQNIQTNLCGQTSLL
ncbi:hypothetical protein J6590_042746, partial [Homalodisca vitripennis]